MAGRLTRELTSRPRLEWALRGAIALAALAIGYVSTKQTLAMTIATSSPERAYALYPGDGRIAAKWAERILVNEGNGTSNDRRSAKIAQRALIAEPTAAAALIPLAVEAQVRGDIPMARRLLTHSDVLSRRELGTRLLLIEDAVARGNVSNALHQYDIALRTSRGASDTLFPVLNAAINDPAIVQPLSDLLAKRPPWGEAFVRYVIATDNSHSTMISLFGALLKRRVPVPEDIKAAFVNRLATQGQVADAWTFYRSMRGSVDRSRSRDPAFTAQYPEPTVFDWMPIMNDTGITASIRQTDQGGVFEFAAPSTVGGIVLEQMQRLPPGRYRLTGKASGLDQAANARPYWALVCNDAKELGRIEMPEPTAGSVRFDGEFVVAGRCPAQLLRLVARPSSAVAGISGQIDQALLKPVAGR